MTDRYPFRKRNHYPHMMPNDVAIWERFIEQFPDAYDEVEYDVKVGTVPEFVAGHEDTTMQQQAPLYLRKIDVIGYKGEQMDIIELKPNAGTSTIGQVIGYRLLYMREHPEAGTPKAVIITDAAHPDVGFAASAQGVQIVVV